MDALGEFAGVYGAKGLAWLKVDAEGLKGPIAKFFEGEAATSLIKYIRSTEGDLLLFVADKKSVVADTLGALTFKTWKRT